LLTRECKWLSYGGDVGGFARPQLAECPDAPEPAETGINIGITIGTNIAP